MPPISMQQSAPGSKSAKFIQTNPLDPMIKPFESDNDPERSALADNVNQRLQSTIQDLQTKHRNGTNEVDHPDRAPTGPAYRQQQQQQQLQQQQAAMQQQQQQAAIQQQQQKQQQSTDKAFQTELAKLKLEDDNNSDNDSDDDEFDDLLDDPALDELREERLHEMKRIHDQKMEFLALGHGQYRTIAQDDFLQECNTPHFVVAHFAHDPFVRCQVMDMHLKELSQQYVECKMVRVVAEKAPFFVQKLKVRTLPTLLVFENGQLKDRLTGFEGLVPPGKESPSQNDDNNNKQTETFETWRLAKWLSTTGAISTYKGPQGEEREALMEQKRAAVKQKGTVYRGGFMTAPEADES